MTDFPIMRGNAAMARGASYFEVPLFSHIIDNLWSGCSPAEFPDYMQDHDYDHAKLYTAGTITLSCEEELGDCHWLYEIQPDGYEVKPRFEKIMNLYPWGKYNVPEGTEKLDVIMYDGDEVSGKLDEVVAQVIKWLQKGHKTLVHCQAGLNRSSLVVARVLMIRYGMTADEAIDRIRAQRSSMCLCNNSFRQYLKGL